MSELAPSEKPAARDTAAAFRDKARATLSRWRAPVLLCALMALAETAPIASYSRPLLSRQPLSGMLWLACAGIGTAAGYLALIALACRRRWLALLALPAAALAGGVAQFVHFGVHRELGVLPGVGSVDFVRQNSRYAATLFVDRFDARAIALGVALIIASLAVMFRASSAARGSSRSALLGSMLLALASSALVPAPFLSTSQRAAQLAIQSLFGPGAVNLAWVPDRMRPPSEAPRHAMNVILFRLEEVAADATSLTRASLPTTPFLKALADQHPEATWLGLRHFSNSTATDVSVLGIFTGLAPAAPLEAQRRVPLLWDYFTAAGYDTSLFLPDHLEWGDFRRRFQARPGELNLNAVVDASSSPAPLVYDHSLNDSAVIADALAYQERRRWAEPFLQVISLRMPHWLGEGARINQLGRGPWPGEPRELWNYYDAIRHDDALMADFVAKVPDLVRQRTALVFVSDHGTCLFPRREGDIDLPRLDNYHLEATRVPFVIHLPQEARQGLDGEKLRRLRENLSRHATSNIDVVPTLLGLVGIRRVELPLPGAAWLSGRDLTEAVDASAAIVQCNTGPLRRWDREHFALVTGDGAQHYFAGAGGERLFDLRQDPLERVDVAADAAFREPLERARALARATPELWRIHEKYSGAKAARTPRLEPIEAASSGARAVAVQATLPAPERSVLSPGAPDRLLAVHAIAASDGAVVVRFTVRVASGTGHLDWRVRGAPDISHVAHVDGLEAGDLQRFEFRWHPPAGSDLPLDIQLFGGADAEEALELKMEPPEARRSLIEGGPRLEVLAFYTEPGRDGELGAPRADAAAPLERFTRHACLDAAPPEFCPNGFLSWGPYLPGRRGARVSSRYEIRVNASAPKIWLDIAAAKGSRLIARSRSVMLAGPSSRTLLLHGRLDADAADLEGRLNAHGGARLAPGAVVVNDAALRVEAAPDATRLTHAP